MSAKKILVAAGGTGGHIIPALSIISELQKKKAKILFVGNKNSMEEKLVRSQNIDFERIDIQKFYRYFTFKHILFPFKLLKSIWKAKKFIREFQPDIFLGTGGFISGPVGYAAYLAKIPIFLQEQNCYPGMTTRLLSKYAKTIFLGNAKARYYLPSNKIIFSGNPINQSVLHENQQIDFFQHNLQENTFKVFLTGGSQGSYILNQNFYSIIEELLAQNIEIIWQIGNFSFGEYLPKIKNKKGLWGFDYTNQIGKIYNSVDLVICRGGALSLSELETKKLPALIIPLPSAAHDHQYHNAKELAEKGVAEIILQSDLNPQKLKDKILEMKERKADIQKNYPASPHQEAANMIAKKMLRN